MAGGGRVVSMRWPISEDAAWDDLCPGHDTHDGFYLYRTTPVDEG